MIKYMYLCKGNPEYYTQITNRSAFKKIDKNVYYRVADVHSSDEEFYASDFADLPKKKVLVHLDHEEEPESLEIYIDGDFGWIIEIESGEPKK